MLSSVHLERRWIMDTFGGFLQYDSISQELITTPFTPQSFPNLFTFTPVPESFPHRAILRLTNSIPSSIPPARFVRVNENEIALQNLETNRHLCSDRYNPKTSWHAERINDWEHFMLLSQEIITGLSILTDPDIAVIFQNDAPAAGLKFTGDINMAKIADREIKLAENLPEIAKLAQYKPHEEISLSFRLYQEEAEKLTLKILPKRAIRLSTLAS